MSVCFFYLAEGSGLLCAWVTLSESAVLGFRLLSGRELFWPRDMNDKLSLGLIYVCDPQLALVLYLFMEVVSGCVVLVSLFWL